MLNGVNYNVMGVTQERFTGLLVGSSPTYGLPLRWSNKSQGPKEGLANWESIQLIAIGR